MQFIRVSDTPGNPGNLLSLLEVLKVYWKLAKSPGNFLAEFVCLLLYDAKFLYFTVYQ